MLSVLVLCEGPWVSFFQFLLAHLALVDEAQAVQIGCSVESQAEQAFKVVGAAQAGQLNRGGGGYGQYLSQILV